MISPQTRTLDWVTHIRDLYPKRDPILIEKMIMALTLVESLEMSGLDFIFKGGTSIILLLSEPYRFSIDIDILIPEEINLDPYFDFILRQGIFNRIESISSFIIVVLFRIVRTTSYWIFYSANLIIQICHP